MASATLPTIPVHQAHTITAPGHVITRAPSGIQLPSTSSSIVSVAIRSLITNVEVELLLSVLRFT